MPDRTRAPKIQAIQQLTLPVPKQFQLDNGIPVYTIDMGTQDVLKVEFVFRAGRPFEDKELVSRATAELLKEGTTQKTAAQIAETIDFYGGSLSAPVNLDTSNVVLYCLNRHFEKLLPLLAELLTSPAFPQKELDSFIRNSQQRLQLDLSKNDVVAYREITEMIFGSEHPYGYNSNANTYGAIERDDLIRHFEKNFTAKNCRIFVSGRIHANTIGLLNDYLGSVLPIGEANQVKLPKTEHQPAHKKISRPEAVQTAIRIGRRLFNRGHADYPGMYVLNTVLGGYFGSRLMANIREEKGYTYNIFSTMDIMHHDGYFYIGTEVGNDFTETTINEIYREMAVLAEKEIDAAELEMVRSYLAGHLLTMLDGPFNIADLVKMYVNRGIPFKAFDELVHVIKTIEPSRLRQLAEKYFKKEDHWEVVVGV